MSYTCLIKSTNAGAGPTYFVPQPVPYMTCPPTNPSGGSSKAMAGAKHANTITDEEAPATTKAHVVDLV